MLLLSITKWCNLLNSQLLVYNSCRQAPPDLSNLLPEGTDSNSDKWLTRHKSIPAFPRRKASASLNRTSFGSKRYIQSNSQIRTRSNRFEIATYSPLTHVLYVAPGTQRKIQMTRHTRSRRKLHDAYSYSLQLFLHFKPNSIHDQFTATFSYSAPPLVDFPKTVFLNASKQLRTGQNQ